MSGLFPQKSCCCWNYAGKNRVPAITTRTLEQESRQQLLTLSNTLLLCVWVFRGCITFWYETFTMTFQGRWFCRSRDRWDVIFFYFLGEKLPARVAKVPAAILNPLGYQLAGLRFFHVIAKSVMFSMFNRRARSRQTEPARLTGAAPPHVIGP